MRRKVLFMSILISLLLYAVTGAFAAPKKKYSQPDFKMFKSMQSIELNISQTYSKAPQFTLPIRDIAVSLLSHTGISITADDKNTMKLNIVITGRPLKFYYNGYGDLYSGTSVEGTITFSIPSGKTYSKSFQCEEVPPMVLTCSDSYVEKIKNPGGAPFDSAVYRVGRGSFLSVLISMINDIYGLDPLIASANEYDHLCSDTNSTKPDYIYSLRNATSGFVWEHAYHQKNFDSINKALKTENSYIRCKAIEALGTLKDPRGIDVLISIFEHEGSKMDVSTRKALFNALSMYKDNRVISLLIGQFKGGFDWSYVYTLEEIGKQTSDPLISALSQALKNGDENTINGTVTTLGRLKEKRAIQLIIQSLKYGLEKKLPEIIYPASGALRDITGQDFGENIDQWEKWWQKK